METEIIESSVDEEVYYEIEEGFLTICRNEDEMRIAADNIKRMARWFKEEIKNEILSLEFKATHAKECRECGKLFFPEYRHTKYCSDECKKSAASFQLEQRRSLPAEEVKEKHISQLDALAREAKEKKLTYGQLQAQRYIESIKY